jgi:hypothetical protein
MQLLFLGLLAAPPDGRRNVFDQTAEIQGLDHAYVKLLPERASRMLRIAQTGQCDRDNSPGFLRRMRVERLHQGKSILPLKQAPMLFPCRQSESDRPDNFGGKP